MNFTFSWDGKNSFGELHYATMTLDNVDKYISISLPKMTSPTNRLNVTVTNVVNFCGRKIF